MSVWGTPERMPVTPPRGDFRLPTLKGHRRGPLSAKPTPTRLLRGVKLTGIHILPRRGRAESFDDSMQFCRPKLMFTLVIDRRLTRRMAAIS